MGAGGKDALERRKLLGDEARDLLEARPVDEDEQVVGSRHEVAGLNLVKTAQPLGQAVEPPAPLGRHLDLDHGPYRGSRLPREVEHRAPAKEYPILLQLLK